jgi:UDP-N-acetylmuramyl pentapeptide phosphotransferase/UDP-N-acetylglucosamine-1-phosphate transferase
MAGLASASLLAIALWVNRRWFGFLPEDPPSLPRKLHERSIPLAGVLLAPATLPWLWLGSADWREPAALLLACGTGFVDDLGKERRDGLDWRIKGILLLGAALLGSSATIDPCTLPWTWLLAAAFAFVVTNAVNFLDNMNGVALALAGVALLALGGEHAPHWTALGFGALGCLPHNWPRARMFLGDAGAYLLGLACGLAALRGWQAGPGPAALWPLAVPLVDFVQVVGARLWLQLPPWVGDRRHLTHLLHHRGVPTWLVAPLLAAVATALAALQ